MHRTASRLVLLLLALMGTGLGGVAWAQTHSRDATVHRCGPDGRELRDSPCLAGPAASSRVAYDQPSQSETLAARQRAAADARRAAEQERSQRDEDERARRAHAGVTALQAPPRPAAAASSPASEKTRKLPKQPQRAHAAHAAHAASSPPASAASGPAR